MIGAALARAYAELQNDKYKDYYRRAVLVLSNANENMIESVSCPGNDPLVLADKAVKNPLRSVLTYVMQLTSSPPKPANGTWAPDLLADKGGTGTAAYKANDGSTKFQEIVNTLATCVYDVKGKANFLVKGDSLSFTSPLTGQSTTLPLNDACSKEKVAGTGFGVTTLTDGDTQRVFLCQDSCSAYQGVLADVSKFSALYKQPSMPVPMSALKTTCSAK
jgi:hypothetical protein